MKIMRIAAAVTAAVLMLVTLSACVDANGESVSVQSAPVQAQAEGTAQEDAEPGLSVWVVYWDQETALDELTVLGDKLDAVCHFSAVFGEDGHLSVPEATSELYRLMPEQSTGAFPLHYLTIVNDVVYESKPSSQKDTDILKPLLASTRSRAAHIGELVELAQSGGYDGLEIDYETLHRQKGLAEDFAAFCGELWEAAAQKGLRLRVVLEPSFPVDKIKLPQGPDYVVMLYNLFGYHSGPGPKADAAFIQEITEKMSVLPGNVIYAFSTGGFDWADDESVTALTEAQALELLSVTGADAQRDSGSGCLVFGYTAEDGSEHAVWFADGETLNYWMDAAEQNGASRQFALWRAGGNSLSSWKSLD